ncbi:MAG: hypothetical protein AAB489_00245 [Patescibacteria group bacterium]
MSEFGGSEIFTPGEGGGAAPEALSEEARQRFAAAAAAMKAIQREEKKSKKRDSRVARTIIQFLNDDRYTHLFVLISRLVARNCPSIFILSILSLINEECHIVVEEYLKEDAAENNAVQDIHLKPSRGIEDHGNRTLIEWITRMQTVLSIDPRTILLTLMVDEKNIDGTVLQLTTFVLEEFFRSKAGGHSHIPFEKLHPLTASILQTVFEPFLEDIEKHLLERSQAGRADKEEQE